MSKHDEIASTILREASAACKVTMAQGSGRLHTEIRTRIIAALAAERERWEAVANYEELARCPKALRLMIAGVVDQCGKGQWFNVTHRLHEVQSEVATRLQRAVNGDPAHMSPDRIGVWGFQDDRGPAAKSALAGPESTQNQHKK